MKVIIAGCRDYVLSTEEIQQSVDLSGFDISEVVSGGAKGVDRTGELWASKNRIPVNRFPADWDRHGKSAGPKRNAEMAQYADALIAFWDGKSRGTLNMIDTMRKAGKPYLIMNIDRQARAISEGKRSI